MERPHGGFLSGFVPCTVRVMSAVAVQNWTSQESEWNFHTLFGNAPWGLARCEPPGTVTAMNPVLEQMLGERPAAGSSPRLADLIDAPDRGETERLLAELFEGKRHYFEVTSKPTDGKDRPVRWTAWKVPEPGGRGSVLALAEDSNVSQIAAANRLPSERLEVVGRLAGGVAHDFNNLLTGILLYCDLLMATLEPGHRARNYAEEIRKAGLQTSGLVKQLLALARPANHQPRLVSLNEITESMGNMLVRLIGENIQIDFRLDPQVGLIRMDATQAQQVLLNLVLNARDAMPCGGRISIATRSCRLEAPSAATTEFFLPCVLLVVEDSGCGMDAATRERLFEPFFTTKGGKGTGLGLATVHNIVMASGGLISVQSELGRGTRISVLLPVAEEAAESHNLVRPIVVSAVSEGEVLS